MQNIKTIALILIAINLIIMINTSFWLSYVIAILTVLICCYNLYLLMKGNDNHA